MKQTDTEISAKLGLLTIITRCLNSVQEFQIANDDIIPIVETINIAADMNFFSDYDLDCAKLVEKLSFKDNEQLDQTLIAILRYLHIAEGATTYAIPIMQKTIETGWSSSSEETIHLCLALLRKVLKFNLLLEVEDLGELQKLITALGSIENQIITKMLPELLFVFEINHSLDEGLENLFKEVRQNYLAPNNYIAWTQSAIQERQEGSDTLTLETKNHWTYNWAEVDPIGLSLFLENRSSKILLNIQGYASLAKFHEGAKDFEKADSFYLQALQLLDPTVIEVGFDISQLQERFANSENFKEMFASILYWRGEMQAQKGQFQIALSTFEAISEDASSRPVADHVVSQIHLLESILPLNQDDTYEEGTAPFAVQQFYEFLQQFVPEEQANYHITQIVTKLGVNLLTQQGINLLKWMTRIGEFFDLSVTQSYPSELWMSLLIRSKLVSTLYPQDSEQKGVISQPEQSFEELWSSLVVNHGIVQQDNLLLCEILLTIITNQEASEEGLSISWVNLLLFCCHLEASQLPKDDTLFFLSHLQHLWLHQFTASPTYQLLDDDINTRFWEAARNLLNFEDISNLFTLNEICTKTSPGENRIEEITAFLETAAALKFDAFYIGYLLSSAGPQRVAGDTTTTAISIDYIREQSEFQFVEAAIGKIFQDRNSLGPITEFAMDNCKMICRNLLSKKCWTFPNIQQLLLVIQSHLDPFEYYEYLDEQSKKSRNKLLGSFCQLVSTIYSYNFDQEIHPEVLQILENSPNTDWITQLGPFTVKQITGYLPAEERPQTDRGRVELLDIMREINNQNSRYLNEIKIISDIMVTIPACDLSQQELLEWAISHNRSETSSEQYMSHVIRGIELFMGFKPRDTQTISVLTLITSYKAGCGRLAKIGTGEGKSIIVAMLAAFMGLQHKTVDVVTCSTVLAERDAKEFTPFFAMFGLTAGDVGGLQTAKGIPKPAYSFDILYGDPSSFQADVLRHEFSMLNTRGTRRFVVAIVDEVDSMLIDQGGNSTRLVDKMPAMEHMELVYLAIWRHLEAISSFLIPIDGDLYYLKIKESDSNRDICTTVSKTLGNYKNGQDLKTALVQFANKAYDTEFSNEESRMAIRTLVQAGIIYTGKHESDEISDEQIDTLIKERWSTSSECELRKMCELLFETKIEVFDMDDGICLDKIYHNSKTQFHDETFTSLNYSRFLVMDHKLIPLEPVPDRKAFLQSRVASEVHKMLEFANNATVDGNSTKFILPPHLSNLYHSKLSKWIDSAITARYNIKELKDYLIKLDEYGGSKIVPIDYQNTGVIQDCTVWSDALHQFLQIKHELALSPEHLATNFLSNMIYFRRYATNIFGLTGTLGSEPERGLLSETYNVDTVIIPTFKIKQHLSLKDIAVPSTTHWLAAIATSVLSHIRLNRGILVVCKSIKDVNTIEAHLSKHIKNLGEIHRKFDRYTRTDMEDEAAVINKAMTPGSVIIATNLAGRGTDVKISELLVSHGGLHVCVTFLPGNFRVEEQAVGRASRKGQPGSSQLILNTQVDGLFEDLKDHLNPEEVKSRRDSEEESSIKTIRSKTIPSLEREEVDFRNYCRIRAQIRNDLTRMDKDGNEEDKVILKHGMAAVDEQWGIALDIHKSRGSAGNLSNEVEQLTKFWGRGNAVYYTLMGNGYNAKSDYTKAIQLYDMATNLDATFSANAFYYKAFSIIQDFGYNYKERACNSLIKAADCINKIYIPNLAGSHQLGTSAEAGGTNIGDELKNNQNQVIQHQGKDTEFTKQIVNKISLLQVMIKSIEEGIKVIRKEKEVEAEMIGIDEYFMEQERVPPQSEIEEFRETGLCGFIKIKKKPPSWWAIFTVILVGVLQVVAGTVLAVCTGGAFGTGLIMDGVSDCITGIKDAIKGEYISIEEFFQQKAIMVMISIAAAGVGAAISAAANAVASVVKNMATKFFSTAIGGAIKGFGKQVAKFGKGVWVHFSKGASKIWTGISKSWDKIKTTKAFEILKTGWIKAKDWVEKTWSSLTKKSSILAPKTLTEVQKNQLKLAAKLIGKEVGKQLVTEGIGLILDHAIISPITDAIKADLSPKIARESEQKMQDSTEAGSVIRKYFCIAKNKQEFDGLFQTFAFAVRHIIVNDFGSGSRGPAALKYIFSSISAVSSEVQRIMRDDKNKKGHRNVISEVVKWTSTIIIESTKFGILVDQLVNYVPRVFEAVKEKFKVLIPPEGEEQTNAPYITTAEGDLDYQKGKKEVCNQMGEQIAEFMAEMIGTGIIKPNFDFTVSKFVAEIDLFKNDKVLKQLGNIQSEQGRPNRAPNSSIYDIIKGPGKGDGASADPTEPNRDNGNQPSSPAETQEHQDRQSLQLMSSELGRPVELYKMDSSTGSLTLDSTFGKFSRSTSEPIRLVKTKNAVVRSKSDNGVRYDPILPGAGGALTAIQTPKESVDYAKVGLNVMSLISSTAVQLDGGDDQIANLLYKMRMQKLSFPGIPTNIVTLKDMKAGRYTI